MEPATADGAGAGGGPAGAHWPTATAHSSGTESRNSAHNHMPQQQPPSNGPTATQPGRNDASTTNGNLQKTPHGFGRPTLSTAQAMSSAMSPGILSEVALLRGLGTKQVVHTIPSNTSSRSASVGSGISTSSGPGFGRIPLPPPPLTSTGGKRDSTGVTATGPSKKKRKTRKPKPLPTQRSSSKVDHLSAAAALRSMASSSSDEESGAGSRKSGRSNSSKASQRQQHHQHLLPPHDAYVQNNKSEPIPPHMHGVLSTGKNRTALLVDHSYTDYSVVDAETLRLLDEEQGLSGSGYEWRGLNEDPFPPRPDEANTTPEEEREMEVAMHNLQMTQLNDPEYQREKDRTIRRLKKLFKGIRPGRRNSGGVIQPFPGKLMEVLDRDDIGDVICWMPHGRSFCVRQPKVFTADILPRFFKQSKYMSFTRQLNLWGFKRITRGRDAGAYYHELFLRGRPRLTLRMRRQKIKGTGIKLTPNPEAEPDFYEMARIRPLPCPTKRDEGGSAPLPPMLEMYNCKKSPNVKGLKQAVEEKSPMPYATPYFPNSESTAAGKGGAAEKSKAKKASKKKKAAKSPPSRASGILNNESSPLPPPPAPPMGSPMIGSPRMMAAAPAPDVSVLAAEIMRQREQAAATELLVANQKESQLEALLRLQAVELKQKQEVAIATQGIGLLQQVEGAIPGAPSAPAVNIPELQQRLLAAAAALDQPAVQAAVMEEQRRAQLAAILAPGSTSSLSSALLSGGVGSDLGLLERLSAENASHNMELELLKQRLSRLPPSASTIHQAATTEGGSSATEILNLAATIDSQRQAVATSSEGGQDIAALQGYAADSQQAAVASAPGSPVLKPAANPVPESDAAPPAAAAAAAAAATSSSAAQVPKEGEN